jgi:hypothetical protein
MMRRLVFRVVAGSWLFGWFCNALGDPGFLQNFLDATQHPIVHDSFPELLRDPRIAFVVYLLPLLCLMPLFRPRLMWMRAASLLMVGTALFSCLHLETCNDATFVTSLWVALWLAWFVWSKRIDPTLARGLAHGVVGVLFLGALVGKLTPEHRSGEAFYRLYFRDNPAWPYPWLREALTRESFRGLATVFARGAIFAETLLSLAPILPTRFVLAVGALTSLTMMVAWTFHLASVLSSILGLLVAALILERRFTKKAFDAADLDSRPSKRSRRPRRDRSYRAG